MWYMIAQSIRNTQDSLDTICQDYDFAYTAEMFPFIIKKLNEYGAFFCPVCKTWRDIKIKMVKKEKCFICHLEMK